MKRQKLKLNSAQLEFIKANYLKMGQKNIADYLGVSIYPVRRAYLQFGLVVTRAQSREMAADKLRGRTIVTPEQDIIIKEHYLTTPVKTLAKKLNISDTALITRLRQLELTIPKKIIEQRKKDSQLKKGNTPINKGKKQTEYMSAEAIAKTTRTRFKKGQIPPNAYGEFGTVSIRHTSKKKGSKPFKCICIKTGQWLPLHTYLWEQENGKVPKGHCLWFIDQNPMNCVLENLELITRKENYARNHPAVRLGDKFVARCIVGRKGNPELILDQPELIELKRQQLKLNKEIKNHDKNANGK